VRSKARTHPRLESTDSRPLPQALELSHRLSTSKIPVVASTASATLRQLFMFVFERVSAEDALIASSTDPSHDASLPPPSFDVDVPPNEIDRAAANSRSAAAPLDEGESESAAAKQQQGGQHGRARSRSIKLRPAARDAYLLLEDLCLLVAGSVEGGPDGEPSFLRWKSLSRTFGLELVESIVSGFGDIVRTVSFLHSPCADIKRPPRAHEPAPFSRTASGAFARFTGSPLPPPDSLPILAASIDAHVIDHLCLFVPAHAPPHARRLSPPQAVLRPPHPRVGDLPDHVCSRGRTGRTR
jgi:hypothetical protein